MTLTNLSVAVIVIGLASIYNTLMILRIMKRENKETLPPIRHRKNNG